MRSVNVAHLKSHLSACLQLVRNGEELLVRDRNTPIARIVPLHPAAENEVELRALAASGDLQLPAQPPVRLENLDQLPTTRRIKRGAARLLEEDRHDRI